MAVKSESLHFRIDPVTLAALRAIAKREDRTLSFVITRVLADYAKRRAKG